MNEKVRQRLAKLIVLNCFRNTHIENIHAGRGLPSEYLAPEYSRITDAEMKELNIEMVNRVFEIVDMFFDGDESHKERRDKVLTYLESKDPQPKWYSPPTRKGGRTKETGSK